LAWFLGSQYLYEKIRAMFSAVTSLKLSIFIQELKTTVPGCQYGAKTISFNLLFD
jgi:hypothetical protein